VVRAEDLEVERAAAVGALARARAHGTAAHLAGDPAEAASQLAAVRAHGARVEYFERADRRLAPASPVDAVMLTPFVHERLGMACAAGDTLCLLGTVDTLRAEIHLDEIDLGIVETDRPVSLRVHAEPGRELRGEVIQVAETASQGRIRMRYRVTVLVENTEGTWRPGMQGVARLDAGRVPLVRHMLDRMARLFRIEFWI
jgi:multidrug efflux pump subunit AcrA (membrane-fusion protein)